MKLKKAIKHIRAGKGGKVGHLPREEQIQLHMQWERSRYRSATAGVWIKLSGLLVMAASPWWAPLMPGVTEAEAAFLQSTFFAVLMVGTSIAMALLVVLIFSPRRPRSLHALDADYERSESLGFGPNASSKQ